MPEKRRERGRCEWAVIVFTTVILRNLPQNFDMCVLLCMYVCTHICIFVILIYKFILLNYNCMIGWIVCFQIYILTHNVENKAFKEVIEFKWGS